ncbi:hypothetical protein WJX72_005574 [[Myrmecia] bisecta]|uniref:Uncharacterized protein n=1 Tax=[Myrmecia] bisecta TaxID=41462 RepID=A0AAW1P389_9CHLO
MIRWWAALPAALQQGFLGLATRLAEETFFPEPGVSSAAFPGPLDPDILSDFISATESADRAAAAREWLDTLSLWTTLCIPEEAGAAGLSVKESYLRHSAGFRLLFCLEECYGASFGRLFHKQERAEEPHAMTQTHKHRLFRILTWHEDAEVDPGVLEYLESVGLPEISRVLPRGLVLLARVPKSEMEAAQTLLQGPQAGRNCRLPSPACHISIHSMVNHVAGELLGEAATGAERQAVWLWGVQLALDAGYQPGESTMEEVRGFMRMRVEDGMRGLWADMQAGDGEKGGPLRSPGSSREQYAHVHKEDGNALYGKGDWPGAFICYSRSLDMQPTAVAFANRAAAQLKLQRWAGVMEDCTEALKLDPGMYKALARRCEAFIALAALNAALADLRALYLQRPCVVAELEDREVKAVRIRILQILERRQAGQSPQACGYSGDLSYYRRLIGQFPIVQAGVKARSLQECLIRITGPTHPRWLSTIRALGQAACQVLRTRHYPSLLNRLAVLLEHHDRTGEPLPDGHTRMTVTELLERAVTDEACTPFTLLGSSPGFLPWCLIFSLTDTKLKALTEGLVKAEGELQPGHDAWDVILANNLDISHKWCPCSMALLLVGDGAVQHDLEMASR